MVYITIIPCSVKFVREILGNHEYFFYILIIKVNRGNFVTNFGILTLPEGCELLLSNDDGPETSSHRPVDPNSKVECNPSI